MPTTNYKRQASIKEETRRRIVGATIGLLNRMWVDEMTLAHIAERAGVSVQSIMRHFGSKESIVRSLTLADVEAALAPGDSDLLHVVHEPRTVVREIFSLYEKAGDPGVPLELQAARFPALGQLATAGRRRHREWLEACFSNKLEATSTADRELLITQLLHLTDHYSWHLYRNVYRLSRADAERALTQLIECALARATQATSTRSQRETKKR